MSGMCAAIGVWVGVWGGAVGEQSPQAGAVALGPGWVGGGPGPQSRVRKWALRPTLHALNPVEEPRRPGSGVGDRASGEELAFPASRRLPPGPSPWPQPPPPGGMTASSRGLRPGSVLSLGRGQAPAGRTPPRPQGAVPASLGCGGPGSLCYCPPWASPLSRTPSSLEGCDDGPWGPRGSSEQPHLGTPDRHHICSVLLAVQGGGAHRPGVRMWPSGGCGSADHDFNEEKSPLQVRST